MKKTLLTLSIVAALGALTACGGGSSSDSSNNGGSTATASRNVSGVITAVNGGAAKTLAGVASGTSITVNGVDYALETDASIDVDDAQGSEADLAVGQVVNMDVADNGDGIYSVSTVEFDDEVQGFVLAANLVDTAGVITGELNVMGQSVTVTADTVFEAGDSTYASLSEIQAGQDVVEVSGYSDGNGNVVATRIEMKDAAEDVEVKGIVSNLDTTAHTFTLGSGLLVDYSGTSDVPENLADGLYVEVKSGEDIGALVDNGTGYTLVAEKVEVQDDGEFGVDGEEGEDVEQQGVISVDAQGNVLFNGQSVTLGTSAAEHGVTLESLALLDGTTVTVEGHIENGAFVIDEVDDGSDDGADVADAGDTSGDATP